MAEEAESFPLQPTERAQKVSDRQWVFMGICIIYSGLRIHKTHPRGRGRRPRRGQWEVNGSMQPPPPPLHLSIFIIFKPSADGFAA